MVRESKYSGGDRHELIAGCLTVQGYGALLVRARVRGFRV